MTHPARALVFEYDAFPPVPKEHWEGSEIRQAMVLAEVLAQHLAHSGLASEEPIQEDFGAVLRVSGSHGAVDVIISFYPRDASDFTWALQFQETKSFVRALFSRRQDERIIGPVMEAVRAVVSANPSLFRHAKWLKACDL
jgi:hypothetical protein